MLPRIGFSARVDLRVRNGLLWLLPRNGLPPLSHTGLSQLLSGVGVSATCACARKQCSTNTMFVFTTFFPRTVTMYRQSSHAAQGLKDFQAGVVGGPAPLTQRLRAAIRIKTKQVGFGATLITDQEICGIALTTRTLHLGFTYRDLTHTRKNVLSADSRARGHKIQHRHRQRGLKAPDYAMPSRCRGCQMRQPPHRARCGAARQTAALGVCTSQERR